MRPFIFGLAFSSGFLCLQASTPSSFMEKYCYNCHGAEKQKGNRRFDTLEFPIHDLASVITAQDAIDQLNLGDMPPEEAPQPTQAERVLVVKAITEQVSKAREQLRSTEGQTLLRRLNRREYLNSLRDLLGMGIRTFDPTSKFPRDRLDGHMDNIGATLVTSGHLLDHYLDAAHLVVEKALGQEVRPPEKNWHFKGNFQQGSELSYSHKKVFNFRYLCLYEVPNTVNHEGGYAAIHDFEEGVPFDGIYEIQVLAHSVNRDTPYRLDVFGTDFSEPFRLGIVPGDQDAGLLHHPQAFEPQLAEVTLGDDEPKWYSLRVPLQAGQTPRFIFPNGLANCRQSFARIARVHKADWPKDDPFDGSIVQARRIVLKYGKMPHIRIHEVKIRGPINQSWPPVSQQIVFGAEGFKEENIEAIIRRFANRAYRRAPTELEIQQLLDVFQSRKQDGRSPRQATIDAIKAALCSPAFLYLAEPGQQQGKLSAHDLASRLSYFLSASTPDTTLRKLADNGVLLKAGELSAQVDRLLANPEAEEFYAGFLDSWLNLRALGGMPPDRAAFREYYSRDLESAMKTEARLFFRNLVENNLPASQFLDSKYTFANKPLARLYGLPAKFEPHRSHVFKKVEFSDSRRGGLLGMGAALTVTANGIETSPVTRGVWFLENLLGTPPPPPPDEVPPIDPDSRGANSIREQLAKHRELPTCAGCHEKIDPPGFALENYDPIGRWRSHYPASRGKRIPIDPSGKLSDGSEFHGIQQFKLHLLKREDLFVRNLITQLLTYATGRRIEALDRPEIEKLLKLSAKSNHRMRDLLQIVIASDVFLRE